jgi:WhiB family redox-sensing transcriptional regulator
MAHFEGKRCWGKQDLFFPIVETEVAVAEAKAICRECPARYACLNFALSTHQPAGVWGGASTEDRKRLRRSRGAA